MVRGERAEAPVPRRDVSFRFDQSTANFNVAFPSRPMHWSVFTEEKRKNELARTEFRFIKATIIIRGGNHLLSFASTSALHCSKRRQISRWPLMADHIRGVYRLKENKSMNLPHENDDENK
jgi:hypothetical protein